MTVTPQDNKCYILWCCHFYLCGAWGQLPILLWAVNWEQSTFQAQISACIQQHKRKSSFLKLRCKFCNSIVLHDPNETSFLFISIGTSSCTLKCTSMKIVESITNIIEIWFDMISINLLYCFENITDSVVLKIANHFAFY